MISSIGQSGLAGMHAGMEGLRQNAAELASARQMQGDPARDVSKPLVEQGENLRQVESSAKVVEASDKMVGTLIDLMA